ncbi:MAG: hypothetical protein AAF902_09525 [Chloroflexota bacterium]
MLSEKVIKFLETDEDTIKLSESTVSKYLNVLNKYALKSDSVVELMSKYLGEFYGKEGHILNLAQDLSKYEESATYHLRNHDNISEKYFSLFDTETEDYLLYNKEDDSVKLIEAPNMKELSNDDYQDRKWNSFNAFLEEFFDLN